MTDVPPLGPPRPMKLPKVAERVLPNGLRVLAVSRPSVPMVELRLRVPFASKAPTHLATSNLLAETLLSGTARRTGVEVASALQGFGASLSVSVDADALGVGGSTLAATLGDTLAVLAEVLTEATYSAPDVVGERDRLIQHLTIARSAPSTVAGEALSARLFGTHPYGRDLPAAEDVAAVTPAKVRALHARRVSPVGATLVLVGDLTGAKALDLVESALAGWSGLDGSAPVPAVPKFVPGGVVVVDRPGSVQTTIRMGAPALPRQHPDNPALVLANMVFGGYFSSRLVANIRERHGYTYSPHSAIDHAQRVSQVVVDADVATQVTAPALLETRYELGRIATVPVDADELSAARAYTIGSLSLSVSTQAGVASTLSRLDAAGLSLDWLRGQIAALGAVTVDDVLRVAGEQLAPARLATVLVGDAAQFRGPVERLLDL